MSRTPRQRRARKMRDAEATEPVIIAEPVPYTPSPEFSRAYSRQLTLEAAVWSEDSRYMRWTLDTCNMGSRLSHSRNRANPTN
jgi:hypothetical protein